MPKEIREMQGKSRHKLRQTTRARCRISSPLSRRWTSRSGRESPGLHYAVKWKRPYYGLPELGWIIELAAYDISVNVVFFGGADFESPPPLGTTDRTRYVK
jgi:hypothetical protein